MITLPALVDRAVTALANARTAAEVLEARDMAAAAYDAAKRAARLGQAKQAHDGLIAAAHRAQADALEIEASAKRRLADEYDAAQERGEVSTQSRHPGSVPKGNTAPATASQVGLSRKAIHEARAIRDAEVAEPGIVRRVADEALAAGQEPSRAKLRRAVAKKSKRVRYSKAPTSVAPEPRAVTDLRRLEVAWEAACDEARAVFLARVVKSC